MADASIPSQVVYVSDVTRATGPLAECTASKALTRLTGEPLEACSGGEARVIASEFHPFIAALHWAFADHRPLVLSPDMFWLLVAQGFARILNADPESMRSLFVAHAGKIELGVRRDEFILGSPNNDWPGVFTEFSEAIREHVGSENYEALVVSFSTTGTTEKAANEIVFLDTMQNYFDLTLRTVCGIPEIILEGTPQDWEHLAERARAVRDRYDCGWWLDHVVPVLDRIASAAAGAEDPSFWDSIYKWNSSSFGLFAGGWVTQFFPFLEIDSEWKRNPFLGSRLDQVGLVEVTRDGKETLDFFGVKSDQWPSALSLAPFVWKYGDKKLDMQFVAGFAYCTQDKKTLAIRPAIGWAVRPVPHVARPSISGRVLGRKGRGSTETN